VTILFVKEKTMEFGYKVVNKNDLVIVTLKGKLEKSSQEMLVKCTEEFLQIESKLVILYFKEVSSIDKTVYRQLALLQQEARKSKRLFLCGFNSALKQELLEKGIIRFNEVKRNLEEVLKEL
jgi:anti-anti-sigma regulatory factor